MIHLTARSNRGRLVIASRPRFGSAQTDKEVPPTVNRGHHVRGNLAAQQDLRGEPAPAPLIFQFIIGVLHVRPLPTQVEHRQQILFSRFPCPAPRFDLVTPRNAVTCA
jgi:hypothetical protein